MSGCVDNEESARDTTAAVMCVCVLSHPGTATEWLLDWNLRWSLQVPAGPCLGKKQADTDRLICTLCDVTCLLSCFQSITSADVVFRFNIAMAKLLKFNDYWTQVKQQQVSLWKKIWLKDHWRVLKHQDQVSTGDFHAVRWLFQAHFSVIWFDSMTASTYQTLKFSFDSLFNCFTFFWKVFHLKIMKYSTLFSAVQFRLTT